MIDSIEDIKRTLNEHLKDNKSLEEYRGYLDLYQPIIESEWRDHICYSDEGYKRNLIFRNEDYEILLLCWKAGQKSQIHDHAPNGCLTKVLQGELTEKRYILDEFDNLNLSKTNVLSTWAISYIDNSVAYHSIGNQGNENAVSLHIYVPSNHIATIYSI